MSHMIISNPRNKAQEMVQNPSSYFSAARERALAEVKAERSRKEQRERQERSSGSSKK
jgi:hypothetical protein